MLFISVWTGALRREAAALFSFGHCTDAKRLGNCRRVSQGLPTRGANQLARRTAGRSTQNAPELAARRCASASLDPPESVSRRAKPDDF